VSLGLGCQACACNLTGSSTADCEQDSGACSCKPGVSGRACNECASGHFGFSSAGCQGTLPVFNSVLRYSDFHSFTLFLLL